MTELSDLELAVSHFLPEVWTPERCRGEAHCYGTSGGKWSCKTCNQEWGTNPHDHIIPCPPKSWEIAGRLLQKLAERQQVIIDYTQSETMGLDGVYIQASADGLIDAIIAAAAAGARKEQTK